MTPGDAPAGRRLWAGLHLLDRQILARDNRFGGCVDDLELTAGEDGNDLYVTAILSGPGALAYRLGHRRFGTWLRSFHGHAATSGDDPTRIRFNLVTDIGSHISVALDEEQVGIASGERWVRDHIIGHIPGSRHEVE